jgi:hypothetical protein
MKTASLKIFPRADYQMKDGSFPIYLRVTINRKHRLFSIGVSVPDLKHWDPGKREIKRHPGRLLRDNQIVSEKWITANKIVNDSEIYQQRLTLDDFDRKFRGPYQNVRDSFYAFADNEIKHMKKTGFSNETIRSYSSYVSKLKKWHQTLSFADITPELFREVNEKMTGIGNQTNTKQKLFAFINTMMNRAQTSGIIMVNPVSGKNPVKKRPGQRDFLSIEEVEKIEKLIPKSNSQKEAITHFLFQCYTGLRYGDLKRL